MDLIFRVMSFSTVPNLIYNDGGRRDVVFIISCARDWNDATAAITTTLILHVHTHACALSFAINSLRETPPTLIGSLRRDLWHCVWLWLKRKYDIVDGTRLDARPPNGDPAAYLKVHLGVRGGTVKEVLLPRHEKRSHVVKKQNTRRFNT